MSLCSQTLYLTKGEKVTITKQKTIECFVHRMIIRKGVCRFGSNFLTVLTADVLMWGEIVYKVLVCNTHFSAWTCVIRPDRALTALSQA